MNFIISFPDGRIYGAFVTETNARNNSNKSVIRFAVDLVLHNNFLSETDKYGNFRLKLPSAHLTRSNVCSRFLRDKVSFKAKLGKLLDCLPQVSLLLINNIY